MTLKPDNPLSIPEFRLGSIRLLFVFATIIMFLIVVAVAWYFMPYKLLRTVQAAGNAVMDDLGTASTYSASTNSFFTNLITYFLPLAIFGLGLWVYVHAQKPKGVYYR